MTDKMRNPKGMGSFKTNEDGTVTHRKSVGHQTNGKRKVLTVTAPNRAACIKKMKEKEAEWERMKELSCVSVAKTVTQLCQLHLEYQVERQELKPKAIDRRETTINQIERSEIGKTQLNAVRAADIDDFISRLIKEKVYSSSSIEKILDVLNAAYNWAVSRGELEKNPLVSIKPSLIKSIKNMEENGATDADVDALTEGEKARLIECTQRVWAGTGNLKYPAGIYGLLLLHTGMRIGEALALRWRDIDLEYGTVNIEKSRSMAKNRNKTKDEVADSMYEGSTKNKKARKLELTEDAIKDLQIIRSRKKYVGPDDFVVINRNGKPHTTQNLEKKMATIYKNAGLTHLKGGVHILRKTFATEKY